MSETERLNDATDGSTERIGQGGEGDNAILSEREAYFQALSLWVQQAQMYHNISKCFRYYTLTFRGLQNNQSNVPLINNNYQFQGPPWRFPVPPNVPPNVQPVANPGETLSAADVIARNGGYEYVIPPLYKRIVAELIDFILLFVLKLIVTFFAVDLFDVIDIEKFNLYKLGEHLDDYKVALEITSEILFLEFIYRILVCIFEASCLCTNTGRAGGATPGKVLLGLRVITASAIVPVPGRDKETVLLYPGMPLTFTVALARSVLKNMLISLLFPLCFIMFVFSHNRTGYDLICGVIVVEENMFPTRRHAP